MNKSLQNKILHIKRKIEKIDYLGGKCIVCGETNPFMLCFHHRSDKEFGINNRKTSNLETIVSEVDKCDLMCNNCHIEHHHMNIDSKFQNNKIQYLNWVGIDKCVECGYNNCNECLDFHHIENKKFKISCIRKSNLASIKYEIMNELSKCIVLCKNCHILKHSNYIFYLQNKELIDGYKKRKISKKVDRLLVKDLYKSGKTQKEISILLSVTKSTISGIIKEINAMPR